MQSKRALPVYKAQKFFHKYVTSLSRRESSEEH
jgi:hypothetical protein